MDWQVNTYTGKLEREAMESKGVRQMDVEGREHSDKCAVETFGSAVLGSAAYRSVGQDGHLKSCISNSLNACSPCRTGPERKLTVSSTSHNAMNENLYQ